MESDVSAWGQRCCSACSPGDACWHDRLGRQGAGSARRMQPPRSRPSPVLLRLTHKGAQALVKLHSMGGHARAGLTARPRWAARARQDTSRLPPACSLASLARPSWAAAADPEAWQHGARHGTRHKRGACARCAEPQQRPAGIRGGRTSSIQGVWTNRGKGARLPLYEASKASFRKVKTSTAPSLQQLGEAGRAP